MLKGKLLAIISGTTSVAVAATTALTLAISGPRDTYSLNALSDNDAVANGITSIFDSASDSVDTVTEVIDIISEDKAAFSMGFNINKIEGFDELSGLGGNLDINMDVEDMKFSIDADAVYGTVELFNSVLYCDFNKKEMVASIPTLFNGILKASIDSDLINEHMNNSYLGSILKAQGFDYDEIKKQLEDALSQASTSLPAFEYEFDYEEFADELTDVINDAFKVAVKNMDVTDNGKMPLNGGKYQCYTAAISVNDLANIVKEAIVYVLKSDEFQDYLDYILEYVQEIEKSNSGYDSDDLEDIYGGMSGMDMSMGETLGSLAPMLETYWPTIVKEIENVLGKNIEFTIYLTDTVETAGFEIYLSQTENGTLSYKKSNVNNSEMAIVIKGDFTGGKEIGDYTYLSLEGLEYGESKIFADYSLKMEANGDFTLNLVAKEEGEQIGAISVDGKYTTKDMFFTLDVDSFKFIEEDETMFDVGFLLSFQPIDSVVRPSGSTEYDLWEMDEEDFNKLGEEISEKVEKIEDILDDLLK